MNKNDTNDITDATRSPRRDPYFLLFDCPPAAVAWKGVALLALVYLGSMLVAALLAPPVYFSVLALAPDSYLAGKSFDDYFDRLRWLPVLLGLPWLMMVCGLWSWQRLGVYWERSAWISVLRGAVAGAILLSLVIVPQLLFSPIQWYADTVQRVVTVLALSLVGACLVSLLEEVVFRGLIFRIFYTALPWVSLAVVVSALFFAYTHFKLPGEVWDGFSGEISWSTGFWVAGWTLIGISQNFEMVPFLNLFLLGVILCLLFLHTRSLSICIGLHAGMVFVLLSYRRLVDVLPAPGRWFWGSDKITDGVWATALLLVVAVSLMCCVVKRHGKNRSTRPVSV